jgi:hypothetical protein
MHFLFILLWFLMCRTQEPEFDTQFVTLLIEDARTSLKISQPDGGGATGKHVSRAFVTVNSGVINSRWTP